MLKIVYMYLRSQLEGYAATIENADEAALFRQIFGQIQFDTKGLCVGAALDVFNGSGLEAHRDNFEVNHINFLTADALQSVFKSSPDME